MKNLFQLHCLVASFPAFASLFAPSGEMASAIMIIGLTALSFYHAVATDCSPYEGAHEDAKRMWAIQILGIMLNLVVFNL